MSSEDWVMQTENYGQGKWWLRAAASSYQDKVRYVTSVGNSLVQVPIVQTHFIVSVQF